MKFKADEIASVIQKEIEGFEAQIDVREVGQGFSAKKYLPTCICISATFAQKCK